MSRFEAAVQQLAAVAPRVLAGWPGSAWEWDERLTCVLSTVAKSGEAGARASLEAVLPQVWSSDTLAQAPVLVRQICGRTGGLLPQQFVFSAELPEGVIAYALWWPWGSGANVSVRIGVSHESVLPAVRAAFGV